MSSQPPTETRTRILDAALHLLETRGAGNIRMEDVAAAAGLSRQAVYMHFGTRPLLFVAMAAHVDEARGLLRLRQRVKDAPSPLDALRAAIELSAAHFPRIHEIALAVEAARYSDPAAKAAWDDRMAERRARMRALVVERFAREGRLDAASSVDEATDLVWALCSIKVWESLVIDAGWTKAKYVEHLFRVLSAGLTGGPSDRGASRRGGK